MKVTKSEYDKLRYIKQREKILKQSSEYQKKNPEKNREKVKRWRENHLTANHKHKRITEIYGLTLDEYTELYNKQNGCCKICRTPIKLVHTSENKKIANVDHDHITGKVRGLLCNSCNQGLGYFKDNSLYLKLAAEYLDACN